MLYPAIVENSELDRTLDVVEAAKALSIPHVHELYLMEIHDFGERPLESGLFPATSTVKVLELRACLFMSEALRGFVRTPEALHTFVYEHAIPADDDNPVMPNLREVHEDLQKHAESLENLCINMWGGLNYTDEFVEFLEGLLVPMPSLSRFPKLKRLRICGIFIGSETGDVIIENRWLDERSNALMDFVPCQLEELHITSAERSFGWLHYALTTLLLNKTKHVPCLKRLIVEMTSFELENWADFWEPDRDEMLPALAEACDVDLVFLDEESAPKLLRRRWGFDENVEWVGRHKGGVGDGQKSRIEVNWEV